MASNDSTTHEQVNSSVKYLNNFKQIQLEDGRLVKPIGMELKQIRVFKYKQFESEKEGYVFDLSQPLTTLVGPNSSGKTTLLEIVRIFCTAVKHGSKCYSLEETESQFGVKEQLWFHGLHVRLQGTFDVHYGNQSEIIKSLTLYVSLEKMFDPEGNICNDGSDGIDDDAIKLPRIHVHVTTPYEDKDTHNDENEDEDEGEDEDGDQRKTIVEECPAIDEHGFLNQCNQNDYGILGDLFPQIILFNSKTVINDVLEGLYNQYPNINQYEEELSKEIWLIFPFIVLSKCSKHVENEENQSQNGEELDTKGPYTLSVDILQRSSHRFKDIALDEIITSYDVRSAGEGVLQCLYIIITICCAKQNSIILIDEPDAHVFAPAQKQLIDFFYRKLEAFRKMNYFCQMVITTHSPEIMQAVKLEDIRQIHLDLELHRIITIKSLGCTGQLLNVMSDIGTAIYSHSELVNLGYHRKLLYLEDHDDYNFLHGIIHRAKPELLHLPFTRMAKRGRTTPEQIKQLILQLRQLVPKKLMIHIFVLVDADLRLKSVLQKEKEDYDELQKDPELNVTIYYHCWAVREWENWLLYNEDLLYEIISGDQLRSIQAIQELRKEIHNHYQSQPVPPTPPTSQQSQPVVTATTTTTSVPLLSECKDQFRKCFVNELQRHADILLNKLIMPVMQGTEKDEHYVRRDLARQAGEKFFRECGVTDEMMNNMGQLRPGIMISTGFHLQQQVEPKKRRLKKNGNKSDNEEECRKDWLSERGLQQLIDCNDLTTRKELDCNDLTTRKELDCNDLTTRKELAKWVDAKLFFYQLTHGTDILHEKIFLDKYWKDAFSLQTGNENHLFCRYFDTLDPQDPQNWPEDFTELLRKFEDFVTAS